jgi:hypothetical protein
VKKRTLLDLSKYLLAGLLLTWVVWANWAPRPTRAVATLGASTLGLCATPTGYGPLLAVASAVPGRTESRGLGYVWERHVVQRQPIHAGYLAVAFTLFTAALLITLFRWFLLVRALELPITWRDALRFGLIGQFFNTFLPGSVGGDIIKAAALARGQTRRTHAVATVVMDRVIALWALVWFVALSGSIFWAAGLLTGPAAATAVWIVRIALTIVGVSLALWVLIGLLPDRRAEKFAARLHRLPLAGHAVAEFWRAAWMYRRRQKCIAGVMLLSWVGHLGFVFAFYCCARVLWSPEMGPIPSLLEHFLLVPIGLVMQALVPTPGGVGGGEWSFAALYLLFRAAEANGVLASLVQRIFTWVLGLCGYVVYLWMRPALPACAEEPGAEPLPGHAVTPRAQSALVG